MRILIINHFPLVGSGSGTYTRNVAVYLAKLGHEVCIIFPENQTEYEQLPNVKMHPVFFTHKESIAGALPFNFPCFTSHPRSTTTFDDLSDVQFAGYVSAFEAAIQEEVTAFQPDIIHGQHVWVLAALGARTGIPTVITAHGTDLMGFQKWPRFQPYAEEAVALAKGIITISVDTDKLIHALLPASREKTYMLTNGYDTGIFYPDIVDRAALLADYGVPPETDFLVMFAGKLTDFKGVDVLLDAAHIYENSGIGKVTTCIAGNGDLLDNLVEQAEDLGLQNMHFLGHVDHENLRKFYSVADVSTVPSRREPFGLVAVEALACGCPIVATNNGGLADIVIPEVGTLVAVDDAEELANGILQELQHPDKLARRLLAAQYAKDRYSQEKNTVLLVDYYNTFIL